MEKEINWILEEKYGGRKTPSFFRDLDKLKRGKQVDYVIGFVKFLNCKIDLSKRPLIPRPETEEWAGKAIGEIRKWKIENRNLRILDIFAGSGCIGTTLLKNVKNSFVDFGEKEKRFCEQIKINAKINKINSKRYKIIQSDIFAEIKGKYDYILANPPYVAENKRNKVQKSVLKFEPKNSVFAGTDGLLYIKKFLSQARNFLNPKGKIYMEFDSWQKAKIEEILNKNRYKEWKFFKDQYGKWRYVVIG